MWFDTFTIKNVQKYKKAINGKNSIQSLSNIIKVSIRIKSIFL